MSVVALTPLVELRQVVKHYQLGEAQITALRHVDVSIHAGEFVAVWGPSGSGKSTLCNLVGLLDTPTSGTVLFKGHDAAALCDNARSAARNEAIGFVFQGFNLVPVLSALENVMLPLQIGRRASRASAEAAHKRLADVGLASFAAHRPTRLSGGQQQRVAIARALVANPALVVADEPTANLDSDNAHRIIDLMREIGHREGTTFVFSTHDDRLLERVDRRIMMRDGALIEDQRREPASRSAVGGLS